MLLHDPKDATMSKTTPVEFRGRSFWAFDVSLSILLAELIESVRDAPGAEDVRDRASGKA